MEHSFWLDRWQREDTGFNQKVAHDLLVKHWPALAVPKAATVFVPMCGRTIDMAWLASAGHRVIGNELSELAVAGFFTDCGLTPERHEAGAHVVWRAGPYELWTGDYFTLPASVTRDVAAIYDRASLVAMPPRMQAGYAAKAAELAPRGSAGLLIALDFDGSRMPGPPFPVPEAEVRRLFGDSFTIETLEHRDGLEMSQNLKQRGLTALDEAAYRLVRR